MRDQGSLKNAHLENSADVKSNTRSQSSIKRAPTKGMEPHEVGSSNLGRNDTLAYAGCGANKHRREPKADVADYSATPPTLISAILPSGVRAMSAEYS